MDLLELKTKNNSKTAKQSVHLLYYVKCFIVPFYIELMKLVTGVNTVQYINVEKKLFLYRLNFFFFKCPGYKLKLVITCLPVCFSSSFCNVLLSSYTCIYSITSAVELNICMGHEQCTLIDIFLINCMFVSKFISVKIFCYFILRSRNSNKHNLKQINGRFLQQ